MATIGLRDIYAAKIIKDDETGTTYDTPMRVGKAITANVQPQFNTAELRADDGVAETAESRGITNVTLNTDDLSPEVQSFLLGKKINSDGVLVDSEDDRPPYVAIMFRSEKANGAYRYVVLYKGKFTLPESNYETKQETPAFQTPTINGRFLRRNSDNLRGAEVDEDQEGLDQSIIDNWFTSVYEETPEV
ncbi:major tail protein [Halalkalibacterium halodurans]|uniref:major tail protein n=1 Tax=Halalkalibacterium halodurans TaxID=86665 RepID=UPI002E203353|nr:major tail protein [Halalkalibacterium halodurans]MED4124030.1 phage tail protein [Halalkalibacterium halodurans]MED4162478.1 phage tail protein [Halalkalibacterium halodurans]